VSTDVLYRWNRQTGELKSFETTSDRPDDFGNTGAWSMIQTATGRLWFATTQGLYAYNPSTQRSRLYKHRPLDPKGLPEKTVLALFADRRGTLWLATESYLCKLVDVEEGIFHNVRFRRYPIRSRSLRPVIQQDGAGRLWLGTE